MISSRSLQAGTRSCPVDEIASYPFNSNDAVTPFEGLMFTVSSQGGLVEVLTLELDVRIVADTDLDIEVYLHNGDYAGVHGNPEEWDLLANTKLVLYPESSKGALLPSHGFKPFTLGQGELKSLYLKMKGPWIDNSIAAPVGDGIILVSPGAGLTESFPVSYDTSYQPMFSGRLHFRIEGACPPNPVTTVEYLIVTDRLATPELLEAIASSVDLTMESLLRVDSTLVQYQNDYDLKQVNRSLSQEVSFTNDCRWERCTTIETTVTWTHTEELEANTFLYRMYTFTDTVADEIKYVLSEGSKFQYIGKEATKVEFKLALKDVREGRTMDQAQKEYFAKHSMNFVNSKAKAKTIHALSMIVDKEIFVLATDTTAELSAEDADGNEADEFNDNVRRDLQELGQLEIEGRILGTRYNYLTEAEFAQQIQDLYDNPGLVRDYVEKMAFEANFPGPMAQFERHQFFEDLVRIDGLVGVDIVDGVIPTQKPVTPTSPEDEDLDNFIVRTIDTVGSWDLKIWIIIGSSVVAVFLAVAVFLVVRCVKEEMESKKRKEERQVDKQFMRQEKRLDDIRRKKMMHEYDGASVYSADMEIADQSFFNESFAESTLDDSQMISQRLRHGGNRAGMAPHGSRRNFYGPALAQLTNGDDLGDLPPEAAIHGGRNMSGGPSRMPPGRSMSGDSRGSQRLSRMTR